MRGCSPSKFHNQKHDKAKLAASYPFQISELNTKLKRNGYLAIKSEWDSGLPQHLLYLYNNWNIYKYILRDDIIQFVKINTFKIFELTYVEKNSSKPKSHLENNSFNIYEKIYPNISYIMEKFREKLKLRTTFNLVQIMFNQNIRDTTTIAHLDQAKNYKIKNNPDSQKIYQLINCIKNQYDIKQTLMDLELLFYLEKFRHDNLKKIYHKIMEQKIENLQLQALKDQNQLVWNSQQSDLFNLSYTSHATPNAPDMLRLRNIIANIDRERLPNNNCLACSKFYYFNINIYDQLATKTPLKVYPSILSLIQVQTEFRDYVCAMLNSQGGVIIFDCIQAYCGVIPRGQFMDLKQKEIFEHRIQSYLKYIYPKIQFGSEVVISFVPVVEYEVKHDLMENYTGNQSILKENRKFVKHPYCNGAFVTRIAVRPLNQSKTYFWEKDQRKYCYILQPDGTKKSLSAKNMLRLIKKKANKFPFTQNLDEDSRRLLGLSSNFLNHQCEQPELGVMAITQRSIQAQEKIELKQCCLLVFRRKNHEKLKNKLADNGIKCQIKNYFQAYSLKIIQITAVLYYNCTFRQLQIELKKEIYNFDGKLPIIINVDGFVKIENKKKKREQEFMNYYRIFSQEFPQERLKLCEYRNSGELYIQTQTKLSMIFMYLQLRERGEQVLFKYPPEWQRMKPQERQNSLIVKFCHPQDR